MRLPCLEMIAHISAHGSPFCVMEFYSYLFISVHNFCAGILFIDIRPGLRYTYNLINRYLFLSFAGEKICLSR